LENYKSKLRLSNVKYHIEQPIKLLHFFAQLSSIHRMHLIEVTTKKQLKEFIYLPEKLYADYPNFVPPLFLDEENFHDPRQNVSLIENETILFLASQDGKIMGRVMGIIHAAYNAQHGEKTARFYKLDFVNDRNVADLLLKGIEAWAISKGMTNMIGPYGFSDKDPQGFQIEGFDYLPVISTPTNPRYLPTILEELGFVKKVDCVSYKILVDEKLQDVFKKVFLRISQNKNLKLLEFKSKASIKPYIIPVFRLMNEAYSNIFGFVPMTEDEMKKFAAQYLPIMDPSFIKVVVDATGEVLAFAVSVPDMSPGFQKANGRLLPFGFLHILLSQWKSTQLDLLLGAIKSEFRRTGLIALLAYPLVCAMIKRKIRVVDSHLILEDNVPMRSVCEIAGGTVYKRFRVFEKNIINSTLLS
jgi:hypothetical protein